MAAAWGLHGYQEPEYSYGVVNIPGSSLLVPSCPPNVTPEACLWSLLEKTWEESWHFGWLGSLKRQEVVNACRTPRLQSHSSIPAVYSDGHAGLGSDSGVSAPSQRAQGVYGGSNGSGELYSSSMSGSPVTHSGVIASSRMPMGMGMGTDMGMGTGTPGAPSYDPADTMRSSISLPTSLPNDAAASQPCPPASKQRQEPVQPAVLGTWVHRQFRMLDPIEEKPVQSKSQPGSIANAAANPIDGHMRQVHSTQDVAQAEAQQAQAEAQQAQAMLIAGGQQPDAAGRMSEGGSDTAAEAAWRWRFARRWHAEQTRMQDPDAAGSCNDKTEDALQYLQAGGGAGWNMQVNVTRTASGEASGMMFSMGNGTLGNGSLLAGDMLLDDGSYAATGVLSGSLKRGMARGEVPTATREVNSLNRRAAALLQQQVELERAADERWRESIAASGAWIGNYMDTVEIDDWGTFRFLLLRLRGRDDKQRILLRGRNYCSEAQLIEDVNRKMMALAARFGVTAEPLEIMGGGVMEWRRDRDRHLHIHSGFISPGPSYAPGKPASVGEMLNLASVLARQQLPAHFKVSCV